MNQRKTKAIIDWIQLPKKKKTIGEFTVDPLTPPLQQVHLLGVESQPDVLESTSLIVGFASPALEA